MKIYQCDACGHEERFTDGIVGNEFDHYGPKHRNKLLHRRRGFETLKESFRKNGVVDVCSVCFKKISDARFNSRQEVERAARNKFFIWLDQFLEREKEPAP